MRVTPRLVSRAPRPKQLEPKNARAAPWASTNFWGKATLAVQPALEAISPRLQIRHRARRARGAFSPQPRLHRPVLLVPAADTEQWRRPTAKSRAALSAAKARTRQKRAGKTPPMLVWIASPGRGATSLARSRRVIARCARWGDTRAGREKIPRARVDHAPRVAFRRRSARPLPTRAGHAHWDKRNRLPHRLSACRACPAGIKIKRGNPNARSAKKGDTRQARTPRLSASCVPGEGTLKRSNPHVRCARRGDTEVGERDKVAKVPHATVALVEDTPRHLVRRP